MMKGTFEAERAVHFAIPKHVPKPLGWGTYKAEPETHFYISEFVDMMDDLPEACDWGETVARLHISTSGKSPGGKFGFGVTTYLANVAVDNSWTDSWELLWAQQMRS